MIDRGIDYRHPDFIDDQGNTRIEYIFDITDNTGINDPDNIYNVGTIYDKAEIQAALDNNTMPPITNDNHGHGTATTGIMCGDGSGTVSREFKGVAPNAKIISIKFIRDGFPASGSMPGESGFFDPGKLPAAFAFAHDKITELGLPSTTLMNFGSINGPTDGTSLICQQIDGYVSQGHPLVCGVGDDGGGENKAVGTIAQGQTIEIEINKVSFGIRFDLWYSELDRFDVSVQRPNGVVEGPFASPVDANSSNDQFPTDMAIYHRGANVEFFGATSNRRDLLIDLSGPTGIYKIILEGKTIGGSGDFIATLNPATYVGANGFLNFIQPQGSINDYSSAFSAISPGDYVVVNDWIDINDVPRSITDQGAPGEIWVGSSEGPTHDGRLGIDFAAPGELCAAAYSSDSFYGRLDANKFQNGNGLYGLQNAVSAAAPVTMGVIALMLEVDPTLNHDQIRTILQQTARTDNFTQTTPNNTWGHGKIDAMAAVQTVLRGSADLVVSDDCIELSERSSTSNYVISGKLSDYNIMLLDNVDNVVVDYSGTTGTTLSIDLSSIGSGDRFIKVVHKTNGDLLVVQRID